ncbi:putative nepenthesin [Helianthus annuus]|nr:putative nepenthesin [Helianthus annuus]
MAVSSCVWLLCASLIFITTAVGIENGAVFRVRSSLIWQQRAVDAIDAHHQLKPPDSHGIYHTVITIGTPPMEYRVQVDTGSDILWIDCHMKGYHDELGHQLYDPNASFTGKLVTCDEEICKDINGAGCKANTSCLYDKSYGDGSNNTGYLVKDLVQYDSVSGDFETRLENASVIFGCRTIQSANLNSSFDGLDGILGFGKSNASVLSQLASLGVKRMFAHCLDGYNSGGIFAIGHVVQPNVINSTPLIPGEEHYTFYVTGIKVGGEFLNLSNGIVEKRKAVIDSGTSLVYLPDVIYKPLVNKILAVQSGMRSHVLLDNFTCIGGSISVDDELPAVTFHFENSLLLKGDLLCLGWQENYMGSTSERDIIVLGELILLDNLFLYDLENQTVGWTEYNCSSSIALTDEASGLVNLVGFGSDSVSSAMSLIIHRFLIFLLLVSLPIIHAK